ncbi:MAG: HmuY family protein [Sandaracinaceae bacterium]
MSRRFAILLLTLATGCAQMLHPDDPDAGSFDAGPWTGGDIPPMSGRFTHSVTDGVVTTVVDATDEAAWQHLDLDTGYSVEVGEGWELAFSRFRIRVNGGVSGAGGVRVVALEGQDFASLTRAPEDGWTQPVPDGDGDEDTEPDNVFNNGEGDGTDWYEYDGETHTLTSRAVTYAIASTEGAFFKLAIDAYYDSAGSPAFIRFRWAPIQPPLSALPDAGPPPMFDAGTMPDATVPPLPEGAILVNAGDGASWVYVSAASGVVTPSDPSTDPSWDLAFSRTLVRTNSGTSGPGVGGAREDDSGVAFEDLDAASTFGFVEDEVVTSGMPGAMPTSVNPGLAGWYDYDPATHSVTPGDRTYLVRTGVGGYAKLRIWRWTDGELALTLSPILRRVEARTLSVDATSADDWVYVSLRDGAAVTVTDASTDGAWDLGISRTRLRTNGGTSGAGMGEAVETSAATIAALTTPPSTGWAADVMRSEGAPGSPEYSGSDVLAGWYDYDPVTHTVSPRPVVFAIRTADGHLGALRIASYAGGAYEIEVAFAGPGQASF